MERSSGQKAGAVTVHVLTHHDGRRELSSSVDLVRRKHRALLVIGHTRADAGRHPKLLTVTLAESLSTLPTRVLSCKGVEAGGSRKSGYCKREREDGEEIDTTDSRAQGGPSEMVAAGVSRESGIQIQEFDAEPLLPVHDDWATWELYRSDYEERTSTLLVIKETESIGKRNEQLSNSKKGTGTCSTCLINCLDGPHD
ncbi:hypothetical protein PC129_g13995 [Phytophthora cactorum]|uniref:Uncharacterized protein n=2 Tax=Phytophthora cactorum TaxID=29920 RepID=A0A8T1K474_9STRA|nr:hypothetical protein PC117_g17049 [Phytophthora cactorum]KAG3004758.1 hypothetical protein PC120_g18355 [Phytophthora cactorum]KAG3215122.1 hypothetical protein PC129_g13995 [Phytophthora cactorum]KAG4231563.1 hypothetical protein PC116_g20171 [Phytophthora cactorum]